MGDALSNNSEIPLYRQLIDLIRDKIDTGLWKSGDQIELNLDMRGRLVSLGKSPENKAIFRGPILLSRDTRLSELALESVITPIADKDGYIELVPVSQKKQELWMEFSAPFVPESYTEGGSTSILVPLCDYASAGNSKEGHPFFKVWLPQFFDPRK